MDTDFFAEGGIFFPVCTWVKKAYRGDDDIGSHNLCEGGEGGAFFYFHINIAY